MVSLSVYVQVLVNDLPLRRSCDVVNDLCLDQAICQCQVSREMLSVDCCSQYHATCELGYHYCYSSVTQVSRRNWQLFFVYNVLWYWFYLVTFLFIHMLKPVYMSVLVSFQLYSSWVSITVTVTVSCIIQTWSWLWNVTAVHLK